MKTFLIAVVLSFVLAPSALLRRNAAWLAEHPAAKLEYSTQLLATHFPIDIKPAGGSLQGKWQIDAKAQSCTLVLSLPGGEERAYTWKGGVEVKAQGGGGWPEVEALLWGACGIWAAGVGGG
ncbi:MAG: hypothetical protein FWC28_02360, partial [Proteobacteria bacterium]|nr:hypothetical protein [Pseudomonadota bacterium]